MEQNKEIKDVFGEGKRIIYNGDIYEVAKFEDVSDCCPKFEIELHFVKSTEYPKARIVEVDDVVEKPITEEPKPYLFEELQRDLKDGKVPNEKIHIGSQHIDFAEFENWKGAKNEKED